MGHRFSEKVKYSPCLFVPTNKASDWKTVGGDNVEKIEFEDIRSAKQFIEKYKDVSNYQIFGNSNFEYVYLQELFPDDIEYSYDSLRIANIDIEVGSEEGFPVVENANEPITAITMKIGDRLYVYGTGDFQTDRKDIVYEKCDDEVELITSFLVDWAKDYPDIVTGWNTSTFDLPYIVNRVTRVMGEEYARILSPWKAFSEREVNILGRSVQMFDIVGIASLDYLEVYKKHAPQPNQESYRLGHIGHVELGKDKVSFEGSLHNLYKTDHQKFIEYNIRDVELVDELNKKLRLLSMVVATAYDAKVNFTDVFSQVRMWDTIIYGYLKKQNLVVPPKKENIGGHLTGAYVKEPHVGLHNYCVSFDVASLYPSLIEQFNISPETLSPEHYKNTTVDDLLDKKIDLGYLKSSRLTLAANGQHFSVDNTGFLPQIINKMTIDRKKFKKMALESEEKLQRAKDELQMRSQAKSS